MMNKEQNCFNCIHCVKDKDFPDEEHYCCKEIGYWFETKEDAINNDNHNCLLSDYDDNGKEIGIAFKFKGE